MKTLYFLEYGMGVTDTPIHKDHSVHLPVMGKALYLLIQKERVYYTICGIIQIPNKPNEFIVYITQATVTR